MAIHAGIFAWIILWTEEPGGLHSMGLQTAGYNLATNAFPHPVISLVLPQTYLLWSMLSFHHGP